MINYIFLSLSELIATTVQLLQASHLISLSHINVYQLNDLCELVDKATPTSELKITQSILFSRIKKWDRAETSIEQAFEISNNKTSKANCYFTKGKIYQWQGKYQQAIHQYDQAVELAGHNRILRAYALLGTGWSYYHLCNYQDAQYAFKQALNCRVEDVKAECRRSLGIVYAEFEKFEESKNNLKEAYENFSNDQYSLMICEIDFGKVALRQREFDRALSHFQHAVKMSAVLRDENNLARCYSNIADAYYHKMDYVSALKFLQKALKLSPFVSLKDETIRRFLIGSQIMRNYAIYTRDDLKKPGDAADLFVKANTYVEQGLEAAKDTGNFRSISELWQSRAAIELDQRYLLAALQAIVKSQLVLTNIPHNERTEHDHKRWDLRSLETSKILYQLVNQVETQTSTLQPPIRWIQTDVLKERINIDSGSYSDYLYQQLLSKLQSIVLDKGRLASEPVARMLATLKGEWFKNLHYTYLGYAWTTATLHLRQLVEKDILEKKGHAKGAVYRLNPKICSLVEE